MKKNILKKLIYLFIFSQITLACNSGSSGSGGGGGVTGDPNNPNNKLENELGYSATQRWPETGDFSYNFNLNVNGSNTCSENKQFGTKAEYCMTLQDQQKNETCSLEFRKSTYLGNCGSDFQEINITHVYFKSGYDDYLKKQCKTDRLKSGEVLLTTKNYCDFLKNETRHLNCFWQDRFQIYDSLKCQGGFSAKPEQGSDTDPNPILNPNPNPGPTPSPSPDPNDPIENIAVVKFLRSEGIGVHVAWEAIRHSPTLPGEISNSKKLELFWTVLDKYKMDILNRKAQITDIKVTIYTNYRYNPETNDKTLYLDFETTQNQFNSYFPLFDKLLYYIESLNIKIGLIHNSVYNNEDTYLPLITVLNALQKNYETLLKMKGVIKSIDAEDYSSFRPYHNELYLNRKDFSNEFDRYVNLLKPLGDFYAWVNKNEINFITSFDIDKNKDQVHAAFNLLKNNLANLDLMIKNHLLTTLDLDFNNYSSINYIQFQSKLSLKFADKDIQKFNSIIGGLGQASKLSLDLAVPFDLSYINLETDLLSSVKIIENLSSKIKTKISKIKQIRISTNSDYLESSQILVIGFKTSPADTEKIINSIK